MTNPYVPGQTTKRQFNNYSPYQEAMWQAMADTFYANLGGYGHTRLPTPGKAIDLAGFFAWQEKVVSAWEGESHRDVDTVGMKEGDMPGHLWLYWYERMVAAAPLQQTFVYDD